MKQTVSSSEATHGSKRRQKTSAMIRFIPHCLFSPVSPKHFLLPLMHHWKTLLWAEKDGLSPIGYYHKQHSMYRQIWLPVTTIYRSKLPAWRLESCYRCHRVKCCCRPAACQTEKKKNSHLPGSESFQCGAGGIRIRKMPYLVWFRMLCNVCKRLIFQSFHTIRWNKMPLPKITW